METENKKTVIGFEVEAKNPSTIYTIIKYIDGTKDVEKHVFDEDCTMTIEDAIMFATMIAFGIEPQAICDSKLLTSWVESQVIEENDFMFFVDEDCAKQQAQECLEKARAAIEKEKLEKGLL